MRESKGFGMEEGEGDTRGGQQEEDRQRRDFSREGGDRIKKSPHQHFSVSLWELQERREGGRKNGR